MGTQKRTDNSEHGVRGAAESIALHILVSVGRWCQVAWVATVGSLSN